MIRIRPELARLLPQVWHDLNPVFQIQGQVYRAPKGSQRCTLRFELGGQAFFLKRHWGVGWKEIFKNLFNGRLPVLSARNEWRAILQCERLGIATTPLLAWGEEGWNPARLRSFIITRALEPTISLEDYCANWPQSPPTFKEKYTLIQTIAQMTRRLHQAGLNHRDLYLCHFLLQQPWNKATESPQLYLIDLHRVQIHRKLPLRWQAKDLASLDFSSRHIGLSQRDRWRFLKAYFKQPLREILHRHKRLLKQVQHRSLALQAKGIPHE